MDYKQTLMWQEINQTPEIMAEILETNKYMMEGLVSTIKKNKATNFVGVARGSSNNALTYFKYVLEYMSTYTVGLSAPSIITLYHGKINFANSVVIACSQSGTAEDVIEVIKKANEQGAITIAVTSNKESPLAKCAKFPLLNCCGVENSLVATKSFSAETFILLWLASALSGNRDNLKLLKNLKLYVKQAIPQIELLTSVYAEKFKNIEKGFVLSRGLIYGIALESSLMLQETAYANMQGYPSSEFYHGPLAMVNKDTPVIIYCAKYEGDEEIQSKIRADQIRLIERILTLKAPVLLVTNDCLLTGRFSRCDDALLNFSYPEEFTIFAFSIFAQMFACKIGCLKGNDPDNPRSIPKKAVSI
ncbi:MAG: SIS domain-containing protein [Clostridia bacterium]|nr:SIS domain-containing protein [Clostridia bacterium]